MAMGAQRKINYLFASIELFIKKYLTQINTTCCKNILFGRNKRIYLIEHYWIFELTIYLFVINKYSSENEII